MEFTGSLCLAEMAPLLQRFGDLLVIGIVGAMALAGAFKDIPRAPVGEIAFWALHGRKDGGQAWLVSAI